MHSKITLKTLDYMPVSLGFCSPQFAVNAMYQYKKLYIHS